MSIIGIIRIAFKSLARNKTRTFLTMLGIIIGVAAVITMLAIGQGAKKNSRRPNIFYGHKCTYGYS